jgi:hypothetical protein
MIDAGKKYMKNGGKEQVMSDKLKQVVFTESVFKNPGSSLQRLWFFFTLRLCEKSSSRKGAKLKLKAQRVESMPGLSFQTASHHSSRLLVDLTVRRELFRDLALVADDDERHLVAE